MKRYLAIILAALMALACLPAAAEEAAPAEAAAVPAAAGQTVYAKLSVDREAGKNVFTKLGVPEEQLPALDPVLDLLSALGVRVSFPNGGGQVDLDLNGTPVLSLGGTTTEDGMLIAGSLFPNYLVTVSYRTLWGIARLTPVTGGNMPALLPADPETVSTMVYNQNGLYITLSRGDKYLAMTASKAGDGSIDAEVYAMDQEKPVMKLKLTADAEGGQALSLDPEGKTLIAVEDLVSGKESEEKTAFLQEIQMNLFQLMAVPEIAGLMATLTVQQTPAPAEETQQPEADPSAWKTVGDILSLEHTGGMSYGPAGGNMDHYNIIFEYGGKYWLAQAGFSKELFDRYMDLDIMADDYSEKSHALIDPLEITNVVDIGTLAAPQEELDKWIGRTIQDMLDAGWEQIGYESDGKGLSVHMVSGDFQYNVGLDDSVKTPEWGEELNPGDAKIVSITFGGPSFSFDP